MKPNISTDNKNVIIVGLLITAFLLLISSTSQIKKVEGEVDTKNFDSTKLPNHLKPPKKLNNWEQKPSYKRVQKKSNVPFISEIF